MKRHGQLDAANIQARKEQGYRRHQPNVVIGQHRNQQGQIPVVARYGRKQAVVDPDDLKATGNPGKSACKYHGKHHIARRFKPKQVRSKRIAAYGF